MISELDKAARALSFIPAEDRELWVRMAMACKAGLGDAGWSIWDGWSKTASNYDARSVASVWRSVKARGGITIASLYATAKEYGWEPEREEWREEPIQPSRRPPPREVRHDPQRRARATRAAKRMLEAAEITTHPYLESKGFPEVEMAVYDGNLLVPMKPMENYRKLSSLQTITPDGEKKFFSGARAKNCVYHIGPPGTWLFRFYCEGLATALSVRAALKELSMLSPATVCFSSETLGAVRAPRGFVIADHDWWHCNKKHRWDFEAEKCPECGALAIEPAGEKAAKKTGLPYWIPPEPGTDANDFHLEHGLATLASSLSWFLAQTKREQVRRLQ